MSPNTSNFHLTLCPAPGGSIEEICTILSSLHLSIGRIRFDEDIDPGYLFVSVSGCEAAYESSLGMLQAAGYWIMHDQEPVIISIEIYHVPVHPAIVSLLGKVKKEGFRILSLDADDRGKDPSRFCATCISPSVSVAEAFRSWVLEQFPGALCTISDDDAHKRGFYDSYAASIRAITDNTARPPVYDLINRFSHASQSLTWFSRDYLTTLRRALENGEELHKTCKDAFFATIQKIPVAENLTLHCFQLPCGGNIFLLDSPQELVMVDTGYGLYHDDVMQMFAAIGIDISRLTRIFITHGDSDHCGAAGYFSVPVSAHEGTGKVIATRNRAMGSIHEDWIVQEVYTLMINLFGRMHPGESFQFFPPAGDEYIEGFAVLDRMQIGGCEFFILESHGGHQHGLIYLYSRDAGLLFTSDTILNLSGLTESRRQYNGFAVYLVTTVNVDPALVKTERAALTALARKADDLWHKKTGHPLYVACGHGPVSVVTDSGLVRTGTTMQYTHASGRY